MCEDEDGNCEGLDGDLGKLTTSKASNEGFDVGDRGADDAPCHVNLLEDDDGRLREPRVFCHRVAIDVVHSQDGHGDQW